MISHLRGGEVVGFLDDQQVRDAIDDLMQCLLTVLRQRFDPS